MIVRMIGCYGTVCDDGDAGEEQFLKAGVLVDFGSDISR